MIKWIVETAREIKRQWNLPKKKKELTSKDVNNAFIAVVAIAILVSILASKE